MNQEEYDYQNAIFWSEPCGTNRARQMNLDLSKQADLQKFDEWYFSFYPYLLSYLHELDFEGKDVLEIGVGLGSVSRYLSQYVSKLHLLDIADETLQFVQTTIPESFKFSFESCSLFNFKPNKKFDVIVAIGSLHHTGDLERALEHIEELVKPGGRILIMVYYAFHPRRFFYHPFRVAFEFYQSLGFKKGKLTFQENDTNVRKASDSNSKGDAAPFTIFSSRKLFTNRKVSYKVQLNNAHRIPVLNKYVTRNFVLKYLRKIVGCDIYAIGYKSPH